MQSGRFVLAVILMIAVVVITNILFPPVPRRDTAAAGRAILNARRRKGRKKLSVTVGSK